MTPQPYHVQSSVDNPSLFPHQSISALWTGKWQKLANMGVYPFADGKGDDFEPIFQTLIQTNNDDYNVLYDPERYAQPFLPAAEALIAQGKKVEQDGNKKEAAALYLRAAAVCRIGRFPIVRSPMGKKLWELNKTAYMAASPYLSPPSIEVTIPFAHASVEAGEAPGSSIAAYLRIPEGEAPAAGWPVLLLICGLDHYRTDFEQRTARHARDGFACLIVEIPGTGDSPASRSDPLSPDRLWSSVLDWIAAEGPERRLDPARVIARGVSTGGYYAMRIAHTHADRLLAVVAQGGGSHHMFDPAWIRAQNHMEYPYALADALAYKFGYASVDEYAAGAQSRFSLLEAGVFEQTSARLFLINGMEDSIFPIEDSMLALQHGWVKEARFLENRQHVGNPGADDILYQWIEEVICGKRRIIE